MAHLVWAGTGYAPGHLSNSVRFPRRCTTEEQTLVDLPCALQNYLSQPHESSSRAYSRRGLAAFHARRHAVPSTHRSFEDCQGTLCLSFVRARRLRDARPRSAAATCRPTTAQPSLHRPPAFGPALLRSRPLRHEYLTASGGSGQSASKSSEPRIVAQFPKTESP